MYTISISYSWTQHVSKRLATIENGGCTCWEDKISKKQKSATLVDVKENKQTDLRLEKWKASSATTTKKSKLTQEYELQRKFDSFSRFSLSSVHSSEVLCWAFALASRSGDNWFFAMFTKVRWGKMLREWVDVSRQVESMAMHVSYSMCEMFIHARPAPIHLNYAGDFEAIADHAEHFQCRHPLTWAYSTSIHSSFRVIHTILICCTLRMQ